MVYDLEKGLLRLTGTVKTLPMLQQGKNSLQGRRIDIYRNDERMLAWQDCKLTYWQKDSGSGKEQPVHAYSDRMDFDNRNNLGVLTGNVRVTEPRFTMNCARMDIRLAENGPADKKQKAAVSEITGLPDFAPGGRKELKSMHCFGGVRMIREDEPGKVAGKWVKSEILADRSDMMYRDNLLVFTGNVKVHDARMDLDCDKMDVPSKDPVAAAGKTVQKEKNAWGGEKGKKVLDKIICTGNVKSREPRAKMDCDKLTLFFRQAVGSSRQAKQQGMFQSNGTELVYIHTDGNVVFENIPEKKTAKADRNAKAGAGMPTFDSGNPIRMTADRGRLDLPGNVSEFHGNVRIREAQGQLDCQDLYLYGRNAIPQKVAQTAEKSLDGLDDDPFAQAAGSKQVPQVITLGAGKELDRVVALKDVVLPEKAEVIIPVYWKGSKY